MLEEVARLLVPIKVAGFSGAELREMVNTFDLICRP